MAFTSDTSEATCMHCLVTGGLKWLPGTVVDLQYPEHTVEKRELGAIIEGSHTDSHGQSLNVKVVGQCQIPWLHCDCGYGKGRKFL